MRKRGNPLLFWNASKNDASQNVPGWKAETQEHQHEILVEQLNENWMKLKLKINDVKTIWKCDIRIAEVHCVRKST